MDGGSKPSHSKGERLLVCYNRPTDHSCRRAAGFSPEISKRRFPSPCAAKAAGLLTRAGAGFWMRRGRLQWSALATALRKLGARWRNSRHESHSRTLRNFTRRPQKSWLRGSWPWPRRISATVGAFTLPLAARKRQKPRSSWYGSITWKSDNRIATALFRGARATMGARWER